MFHDLLAEPVLFETPWENETLPQRLCELLAGEGEKVAYIYEWPDSSTFRYRVYNIMEALRAAGDDRVSASWFSAREIDSLRACLHRITTLVLARVRITRAVSDLIAAAQLNGVRVLLDCDDLVFDPRYAQTVSVNNDQNFELEPHLDGWFAYVGRLNATALQCDGGITTNAFLAEKLANVCRGPVSVIPNFLNRRQQNISQHLLEAKAARGFRGDGRVTIGYFSGSPTHNKDFRIALDSLIHLMDEDDSIGVRIAGYMESHVALARFGNRVDVIPFHDWVNLQARIAEVDINIAPLQLNDFTHCKSELKFFEAAVVGTYSVVSKSYTFERAVDHPDDGMVVNNGQWYDGLKHAVALVRDSDAYGQRALKTAERVVARYGWNRNDDAIYNALLRVSAS
ncbi:MULTISPECIES: glycosyltransferase [unclassified Yoonia]|uniref:glycosyltransferase n=1 Tax=unclassified Yoonia TaxID=2629118 RepID=UPI002AFF386C|nr:MULTISPECIES: glycosyltransferase [unclassified Yoonia]